MQASFQSYEPFSLLPGLACRGCDAGCRGLTGVILSRPRNPGNPGSGNRTNTHRVPTSIYKSVDSLSPTAWSIMHLSTWLIAVTTLVLAGAGSATNRTSTPPVEKPLSQLEHVCLLQASRQWPKLSAQQQISS